MSYMNAAVAGAANSRRKPGGRGPMVAVKSKPSKGPGRIETGRAAYYWAQFGGYCMGAKEWLAKAKDHRDQGRPVLAALCVKYARQDGLIARSYYASALVAGKGVGA